MKPWSATISVTLVFMMGASPAVADVDIQPAPLSPKVRVNATKFVPTATSSDRAVRKSDSRQLGPRFIYTQCPVRMDVGNYGCRTSEPNDAERELTDGDVLRAAREIGLPRLAVDIQPGERTLVNAETIFSTETVPFAHDISLLGFDVDLRAQPTGFTWRHGDGTSRTTTTAGRPYPAMDITHRYTHSADVVRPRVDVTYRVRYRVDGGSWRTISQTITAAGPTTALQVSEAVPVLTMP